MLLLLLFTGDIPRVVFCEHSSQKTREVRRKIMRMYDFVQCEVRYQSGCEQALREKEELYL